jgi:hypothetical protein
MGGNMKKIILFFILVGFQISLFSALDTGVKSPTDPTVKGDDAKKNDPKYNINIVIQKQNGIFTEGIVKGMKGFYIKGLVWNSNESANQDILIDFVKNIRVKGYTVVKKTRENLSMVFYYPYQFDIELNDGTKIKDVKGRIKELESFDIFDKVGKEKCFTYFGRYWLEDKKMFNDNKSKNYEEIPVVPKSCVIYIEFKG